MVDDKAHPTTEALRQQRADLDKLIAEATRIRDEIAAHLEKLQRAPHADRHPYEGPNRRRAPRRTGKSSN